MVYYFIMMTIESFRGNLNVGVILGCWFDRIVNGFPVPQGWSAQHPPTPGGYPHVTAYLTLFNKLHWSYLTLV